MFKMSLQQITNEEANLYDRQIRLWGFDAQNRLRNSKVLLIGLSLAGAEIAKNLILTGIKQLHVIDDRKITSVDSVDQCHFLIPCAEDHLGQTLSEACLEACRRLNPLVTVDSRSFDDAKGDFFAAYDLVCLIDCDRSIFHLRKLCQVDDMCRKFNTKIMIVGSYGFFGYSFFDFNDFEYVEEIENDQVSDEPDAKKVKVIEKSLVKRHEKFVPLSQALKINVDPDNRKKFSKIPSGFCTLNILNEFFEKSDKASIELDDLKKLNEIKEKFVKDFSKLIDDSKFDVANFNAERLATGTMSSACAILGGVCGQEIVRALSQNVKPLNNFFFYDGLDATVFKFPPD